MKEKSHLRDGAYYRAQRLETITKNIAAQLAKPENNGRILLSKLYDWIQYEIGLTRTRSQEYVKLICSLHNWQLTENFLSVAKEVPK